MSRLPKDFDVSTIEDLDPEPSTEGRFLHLREFFLGSLLLAAVLGWAGWQWWQQTSMQNNYRLGDQAATAKRWDDAETYFVAAGGYRDAPSRATSAARLITERDSDYNLAYGFAADATSPSRWAAALKLLQRVQEIEPDYRDTSTLTSQAQDRLYADAMQGVIALRTEATGAQPPGLYYRSAAGWAWLKGSDKWSRVRGLNSSNVVVYDVAGAGWSPRPDSTAVPYNRLPRPGSPALQGRSLMALVNPSTAPTYQPLVLDPAYYNSYIVGSKGVWALRFISGDRSPIPLLSPYSNYNLDYQALGNPITATITTVQQQEALLTTSADGGRILLATWNGPMLSELKVNLYIADANGANRYLLYSQAGGIAGAQFSPDGNYILLDAYSLALEDSQEHETALLLSAWGAMPPRILLEKTARVESSGNFFSFPSEIKATFLTKGVDAGKLAMVEQSDGANVITIRDPLTPDLLLLNARVDGPISSLLWADEESGDCLALTGRGHIFNAGPSAVTAFTSTLTLLNRASSSTPTVSRIPLPDLQGEVAAIDAKSDYLIYTYAVLDQQSSVYKVYSLPWQPLGNSEVQPSNILTVDTRNDADALSSSRSPSWAFGATMLAYTRNGELHALTYDGATDVILESGVSNLISSQDQGSYSQLLPWYASMLVPWRYSYLAYTAEMATGSTPGGRSSPWGVPQGIAFTTFHGVCCYTASYTAP